MHFITETAAKYTSQVFCMNMKNIEMCNIFSHVPAVITSFSEECGGVTHVCLELEPVLSCLKAQEDGAIRMVCK